MSVDEMIIASINCLDGIEEHFKTQMIAWVRSAADFGEINDKLVKENAELKEKVSYLKDNLRVARKDRENLQLKVGKGLKEFIKDCPYSALKLYVNGYYVEQLTKAKEIIKDYMIISSNVTVCSVPEENRCINVLKLNKQVEEFLNSEVEE